MVHTPWGLRRFDAAQDRLLPRVVEGCPANLHSMSSPQDSSEIVVAAMMSAKKAPAARLQQCSLGQHNTPRPDAVAERAPAEAGKAHAEEVQRHAGEMPSRDQPVSAPIGSRNTAIENTTPMPASSGAHKTAARPPSDPGLRAVLVAAEAERIELPVFLSHINHVTHP
jgi:hypothetical protein